MTTRSSYNDQPTIEDALGFGPAADALASVIADIPMIDTPLTMGVYGEWGSGKTSMLRMIEHRLTQLPGRTTTVIPLWFEAWRYAQQDTALWRALLLRIVAALRGALLDSEALLQALYSDETVEAARAALTQQLETIETQLFRSFARFERGYRA